MTGHMLGYKIGFTIFKKIPILPSIFFNPYDMKHEVNNRINVAIKEQCLTIGNAADR